MTSDIFEADPFLINRESQREYGEVLLENILLRRTTLSPTTIMKDLSATSPAPPTAPTAPAPKNATDLAKKYAAERMMRKSQLTKDERELLKKYTMVSKGEETSRRVRGPQKANNQKKARFLAHHKAAQASKRWTTSIDQRLRIATVGIRVKISKRTGEAFFGEDLCMMEPPPSPVRLPGLPDAFGLPQLGRTTVAPSAPNGHWERWMGTVTSHIKTALDSGSHIVVLPEFALPPDKDEQSAEARIRAEICAAGGARPSSQFVFAGTRHDGGTNRGLVLQLSGGKCAHTPEWHYKTASARALRENILGPQSEDSATYVVDFDVGGESRKAHITIAICYDSFDPSMFLSLVMQSYQHVPLGTPRIILVPAFNPAEEFVQLLRDLSFLTRSIVVYVNSLHGDARAFIAGVSVKNLIDQTEDTLLGQIDDHIKNLEMRKEDLRKDKAKAQKNLSIADDQAARDNFAANKTDLMEMREFRAEMKTLLDSHCLDHVITVEHCEACETHSHTDDYECKSDILYYNIDMGLLAALLEWHESYVKRDETFLLSPLRTKQLLSAVNRHMDVKRKRAQRA
jgi:hypothetical protein